MTLTCVSDYLEFKQLYVVVQSQKNRSKPSVLHESKRDNCVGLVGSICIGANSCRSTLRPNPARIDLKGVRKNVHGSGAYRDNIF